MTEQQNGKTRMGLPITAISFSGFAALMGILGILGAVTDNGQLFAIGILVPHAFAVTGLILGIIALATNRDRSTVRLALSIGAISLSLMSFLFVTAAWNVV